LDSQSLFFVLVVIAIGGISAYLADILGYKIGKKRLSIKRIRPKYVARISVVIAGMLIPIFTMLLLYGVSSTFRTWITRGSAIVRDLEQKSKEVDKINAKLVEGETKNASLDNKNRVLEDLNKKKQAEAKLQEAKVNGLNSQVSTLTSNIRSIEGEKKSALAQLEPIRAKLQSLQRQLPEAQKSLEAAKTALKEADDKFKDASTKYNSTSNRNLTLTNENLKLANTNAELTKKNDEIKKISDDLQGIIDNLNKDLAVLKSEKALAESEKNRVDAELKQASQNLLTIIDEANAILKAALEDNAKFYRTQTISYLRGEELARTSVPEKPSVEVAKNAYRAILRRAKSIATDRGSKSDPNYPFTGSAGIIRDDSRRRYLSEDDVEKFWVEDIRRLPTDSVIIAQAHSNRFASEPVTLELIIKPNPIVFRKGEIVTESKIDGRISEIEILNGIREFLQTYVNTKARSRNMIPVQSRNGVSYGEYTQNQLLSTVAKVKAVPRLVRLVAVAKQDMRAGDPLDIDIEVR
jgi:uncharacterized protein (DUF3084 family)